MTITDAPPQLDERTSYAPLAPHYDAFTDHPGHDAWFRRLEALARRHGASGRRALDVGCGTGKSTRALVELGYEVVACEPCAEMLAIAERKLGGRAELVHEAAETLGELGRFDYVSCVNDVCNYMLDPERLTGAFRALAANLADDGVLLFDTNTPVTYLDYFAGTRFSESAAGKLVFHGFDRDTFAPNEIVEARVDVFEPEGELWRHRTLSHAQRHYDTETIEELLAAAGLRVVGVYGQTDAGPLEQPVEPERHTKAIFVAKRRPAADGRPSRR